MCLLSIYNSILWGGETKQGVCEPSHKTNKQKHCGQTILVSSHRLVVVQTKAHLLHALPSAIRSLFSDFHVARKKPLACKHMLRVSPTLTSSTQLRPLHFYARGSNNIHRQRTSWCNPRLPMVQKTAADQSCPRPPRSRPYIHDPSRST